MPALVFPSKSPHTNVVEAEHEQVLVRRKKLAELVRLGCAPYPNDFRPRDDAGELLARFGAASATELDAAHVTVALAGRLVAIRDFGKAVVPASAGSRRPPPGLRQARRRRRRGLGALSASSTSATSSASSARLFRTKTNELTVEARSIRVPRQGAAAAAGEVARPHRRRGRYRQRYLDLIANPKTREVFRARARIIQGLRSFFAARGFVEVETPMMQAIAGGARRARSSPTTTRSTSTSTCASPPSSTSSGCSSAASIASSSSTASSATRASRPEHNPEFTMLEFYQAYATYEDLMELTEKLFVELAATSPAGSSLPYGEHTIDLTPPWTRLDREGRRRHVHRARARRGRRRVGAPRVRRAPCDPASRRRAVRQGLDRSLREAGRGRARPAHLRHRVPGRGLAAGAPPIAIPRSSTASSSSSPAGSSPTPSPS